VSDVDRKSFAVGVLLFAQEEIQLIDTVNRAILRNLRSTHTGKGRIEVYNVNDLIADSGLPGHRIMNGARSEASIAVKYVPRHSVASRGQQLRAATGVC
jgi:hypothetical protein